MRIGTLLTIVLGKLAHEQCVSKYRARLQDYLTQWLGACPFSNT